MPDKEKVHTQVDLGVRHIVRRHFKLPADRELSNTTHLMNDLGGDSLSLMELQLELEDWLSIRLGDDEIAGVLTIGALVDVIERKVGGNA